MSTSPWLTRRTVRCDVITISLNTSLSFRIPKGVQDMYKRLDDKVDLGISPLEAMWRFLFQKLCLSQDKHGQDDRHFFCLRICWHDQKTSPLHANYLQKTFFHSATFYDQTLFDSWEIHRFFLIITATAVFREMHTDIHKWIHRRAHSNVSHHACYFDSALSKCTRAFIFRTIKNSALFRLL